MKNMKNMLNQISSLPFYKKIHYIENIALFKEEIPKHLSKHILSIKQKGKKLYIVTSHSAITTELNHKKDEIYFILKLLQKHKKILLEVEKINIFTSYDKKNTKNINESNSSKQEYVYKERSCATFINHFDDISLYNKLEKIRDNIENL